MKGIRFVCLLGLLGAACGREGGEGEQDFRATSPSYAGLTWKVEQETIRVCYSDRSNSDRHREDVKSSIMAWIEPLRDVASVDLAKEVQLVGANDACDAKVYIGNYSPAYARMGSVPRLYINYSGWYGSKTVTLHEFGHAFGLLDTYSGRGGSCQRGQPNSVMCRASYDDLKDDDVDGIRYMYDKVRQGLVRKTSDDEFKFVY